MNRTENSPSPFQELTDSNVRKAVDDILADQWYWFPVRHHSPATAFHLKKVIEKRRPKLIFVEGPWEANHLLETIIDTKTKPPVAVYSSFQDDENLFGYAGVLSPDTSVPARWACWYPLVEYSPEWIALKTAKQIGAEVCFMDLPHFHRIQPNPDLENESATDEAKEHDEYGKVDPSRDNPNHALGSDRTQGDRLIFESDFYQALAAAGNYTNWDQVWDSLFECRQFPDSESFRKELLTFCVAARLSSNVTKTETAETLDRERFMIRTIRQETEKRNLDPSDVMIVCGGYHTLLDQTDSKEPPGQPKGTVYCSLVPYSYFRIADVSGYGAGNRAPLYYSRHWQTLNGKVENPEADYIVSVLQKARKNGEPVSSADAISISQHARLLAALRGRSKPILDDLQDAIMTCCCKGNPNAEGIGLQKAIDQINIGNRIGKVPPAAPQLPIVRDFYQHIAEKGLDSFIEKEKLKRLKVDRRKEEDLEKSTFFHRLQFCKVPFCQRASTVDSDFDSGLIFQEAWQVKWSPDVESKLIDLNLLGDTLEMVGINFLKKEIYDQKADASSVSKALVDVVKMDLPNMVEQIFQTVSEVFQKEDRFVSLAGALTHLLVLERYFEAQDSKLEKTRTLIESVFQRCCFAIPSISSAPDDQHSRIVDGIKVVADFVIKGRCDQPDRDLFENAVKETIAETEVPFLRGAMLGLAKEIRLVQSSVVSSEVLSFAQGTQDQLVKAGEFIHGLISVSRTSLVTGAKEMVSAINQLIRLSDWESYTVMLPSLRAAMELLHSRHRSSISEQVAELYGLAEPESLSRLEVPVKDGLGIVELDKQVAEIMAEWSFS